MKYRYYHDGTGRLVLVDAPPLVGETLAAGDQASVDAEYSYDPNGNLIRVLLLPSLPTNPFASWSGVVRKSPCPIASWIWSAAP